MLLQIAAIGHCLVALNGPWRFHTGDDARWADPGFDDSGWEKVDLTPAAGAHDPDVGLTGYVPGWTAKGHPGYSGVAWYRLRVSFVASAGDTLTILGPSAVDDGYRIFVNGTPIGGGGAPYSVQPRLFVVPRSSSMTPATIAIRVWADASTVRDSPSDAGGIHVAPALGGISPARDRYGVQWSQTLWGYVVDAVEPVAFVLLAVLVLAFGQGWMAGALVLSAILRVNQVTFYWGQFETAQAAVGVVVVIVPLIIGAWLMAWRRWFNVQRPWTQPALIAALVAFMYLTAVGPWARVAAALIMVAMMIEGRQQPLSVVAAGLVSIGLFATELSALRIPGIWFPFGVGVSRTQFAYAAFDIVLFAICVWRIRTGQRSVAAQGNDRIDSGRAARWDAGGG